MIAVFFMTFVGGACLGQGLCMLKAEEEWTPDRGTALFSVAFGVVLSLGGVALYYAGIRP